MFNFVRKFLQARRLSGLGWHHLPHYAHVSSSFILPQFVFGKGLGSHLDVMLRFQSTGAKSLFYDQIPTIKSIFGVLSKNSVSGGVLDFFFDENNCFWFYRSRPSTSSIDVTVAHQFCVINLKIIFLELATWLLVSLF